MNGVTYEEVTGISVPALVRLAEPAAALSLAARVPRARAGGGWTARFKGRGMEFDEVRPYEPGDDIRSLDWKVTARTGEPYTKLFREERERPVLIALDLRAPMFFATRGAYKSVVAAHAAALLAWSAARGGDRTGGLVFADTEHSEVKPMRGRRAVLDFIHRLAAHPAWASPERHYRAGGLDEAAGRLHRVVKPGSLVFVLSDFRGLGAAGQSELVGLARHSDITLLHLYDPVEAAAPPPGRYVVSDGRRRLEFDSRDPGVAARYARGFEQRRALVRETARRARANCIELTTAADLVPALAAGLRRRAH